MVNEIIVKPYSEFNWWFTYVNGRTWRAINKLSGVACRVLAADTVSLLPDICFTATCQDTLPQQVLDSTDVILSEFDEFLNHRYEGGLHENSAWFSPVSQEDAVICYEALIRACILHRAYVHVPPSSLTAVDIDSVAEPTIQKILNWLRANTDFYTAPASTRFHEAFEGGLCFHSIQVAKYSIELLNVPKFGATRGDSHISAAQVVLLALVHDWCKIGTYEKYLKNVKDEVTGQWNKVEAFKHKDCISYPFGHGVASTVLANQWFKLTPAEMLAIRWHMGKWRVCDSEINELQQANEASPLVHLLQFADQLSITKY